MIVLLAAATGAFALWVTLLVRSLVRYAIFAARARRDGGSFAIRSDPRFRPDRIALTLSTAVTLVLAAVYVLALFALG